MKEDYLWDKTGGDAEIEQLENALAAFRFRESEPPALPQKVFALEKSPRRNFFRFAFGFAAFASVLIVLGVVWFQLSGDQTTAVVETVRETNESKRAEKTADNSYVAPRTPVAEVTPFEENTPAVAPKIVKIRQPIAPVPRRRNQTVAARTKKFVEPEEPLTKEEKYAYDQLMLALTITGSKLKIVQDKINNIEEQNAVVEK